MRTLLLLCAILVAVGCNAPPSDPGRLVLILESPPGPAINGLNFATINVTAVQAVVRSDKDDPSTEEVFDLDAEPEIVSLQGLERGTPRIAGVYFVEPGWLVQLRFVSQEGSVGIDGQTFEAKLPSFPETGLKVVVSEPARIRDERYTFLKLFFDPDHQIESPPGQGYLFKPTIPAEQIHPKILGSFVPQEVFVQLNIGGEFEDLDSLATDAAAQLVDSRGLLGVFRLPETTSEDDLDSFIDALNDQPGVATASRHALVTPTSTTPSDPFFGSQWGLSKISAPQAWDVTTGSAGVTLAVIDCGMTPHDDLWPNLLVNEGELPAGLPFQPDDADGDGILTMRDLNAPINVGVVGDCDLDGLIDPEDVAYRFDSGHPDCHGLANDQDDDFLMVNSQNLGTIYTVDDLLGIDFSSGVSGVPDQPGEGFPIGALNFEDCQNPGFFAHGTQVASVAAAVGNNASEISGTAWQVGLLPIKILDDFSGSATPIEISTALEYARLRALARIGDRLEGGGPARRASVDSRKRSIKRVGALRGATIANLSWATEAKVSASVHNSQTLEWEIRVQTFADGMLLPSAAGNLGQDCDSGKFLCVPAEIDRAEVIGVTGSDQNDKKAKGSNFGNSKIDIAAPGSAIPCLADFTGTTYASGTSIATPFVSGTLVLIQSARPELQSDFEATRRQLLDHADNPSSLNNRVKSNRRLNAYRPLVE